MRHVRLLVFIFALTGLHFEVCAEEPVAVPVDLEIQIPTVVPDEMSREVQQSADAGNTQAFNEAQQQRVELVLSYAEGNFRRAFRHARQFVVGGTVTEYFLHRLEPYQSTVEVVPFPAEYGSKTLVAFMRKNPATNKRVALFADGSVSRIDNATELRALIYAAVRGSHGSLELQRDSTLDEDRIFLDALGQLSHEDFDQREAASARLREAGLKALPILTLGAKSKDPERRERCRDALVRLERFVALRPYVVDLRKELGLPEVADSGKPAIPESIRVSGETVVVGGKEFPLAMVREAFPDIYVNLMGGE